MVSATIRHEICNFQFFHDLFFRHWAMNTKKNKHFQLTVCRILKYNLCLWDYDKHNVKSYSTPQGKFLFLERLFSRILPKNVFNLMTRVNINVNMPQAKIKTWIFKSSLIWMIIVYWWNYFYKLNIGKRWMKTSEIKSRKMFITVAYVLDC